MGKPTGQFTSILRATDLPLKTKVLLYLHHIAIRQPDGWFAMVSLGKILETLEIDSRKETQEILASLPIREGVATFKNRKVSGFYLIDENSQDNRNTGTQDLRNRGLKEHGPRFEPESEPRSEPKSSEPVLPPNDAQSHEISVSNEVTGAKSQPRSEPKSEPRLQPESKPGLRPSIDLHDVKNISDEEFFKLFPLESIRQPTPTPPIKKQSWSETLGEEGYPVGEDK